MTREEIVARLQPLLPVPTGLTPRLRPLPGIRAVIFDIYGTLLISAAGDSVGDDESALRTCGFPLPDSPLLPALRERIAREHARSGLPFPEIDIAALWSGLLPELDDPETFALAADCALHPVWPMPGAADAIVELERRGSALGIVSNAQRHTPWLLDRLLGGAGRFDPALCRYSWEEGRAKPDPALFESVRAALRQRDIGPRETLFIGNDVRNDIGPARTCGFLTALFAGDSRSLRLRNATPDDCGADLVLTDWDQLGNCLP